jgi:hypothetical protein
VPREMCSRRVSSRVIRSRTTQIILAATLLGAASAAPAQTHPQTIVLWTSTVPASNIHGSWQRVADPSAAGGAALTIPDRGTPKISPALAAPGSYFEIAFSAQAAVAYHLWVRLRAEGNKTSNDSIHVQFNDSTDITGTPIARIGTTGSAEVTLQDGASGAPLQNWGWADNGWGTAGAPILFAADGTHVIRVQQREDGAFVDQIVLSADAFSSTAPGTTVNDTTTFDSTDGTPVPILSAAGTDVLWPGSLPASALIGNWRPVVDASAAGGTALRNADAGQAKIAGALANPPDAFDVTFNADAGVPYHVWIRMRADGDSLANDSVYVQFDDTLDANGAAFARIGTATAAEFVLQSGPGAAPPRGWGWTDNGWGTLGTHVQFESTGRHTLRVQQREDGATIDQIVISPDAYLTNAPGPRRDDTTLLPETATGATAVTPAAVDANQPPSITLTAPANEASLLEPAEVTITASASDPEGRLASVEFYSGTKLLGSAATAPYSITVSGVPAGSYTLTATAYDLDGGQSTSAPVPITVAGNQPPTVTVTSPANNAIFTAPATIAIAATAADPENRLARVEFYTGGKLIVSDESAPYEVVVPLVPVGTYTLTAVAYDQDGRRTIAEPVTIQVGATPPPPPPTYAAAFTASVDHDTNVTSYLLEVFANDADPASAQPLASTDLGKPTPAANGDIVVDETSFLSPLTSGTYIVTVSAIGPGGQTRSTPYSFTK